MKITTCIQARNTGRILFIQETGSKNWTWPATMDNFIWLGQSLAGSSHTSRSPTDSLRQELNRVYPVDKATLLQWFICKKYINTVLIHVPTEDECVSEFSGHWAWHSMFEFPEKLDRLVRAASGDLCFLGHLVNPDTL